MAEETRARCIELAEEAKAKADGFVSQFEDNYRGKVMFCLSLASSIMVIRQLVPALDGTGQDFIDKVKEGTVLWVELGEPLAGELGEHA